MDTVTHQSEVTSPASSRRQAWGAWFGPGEPHAARGPFDRWPHVADAVLAVVVFAISAITITVSALDDGEDLTVASIGDRPAGGFVLLGVAAATLLWRRRHPIAVTITVLVVMIAWAVAGYGDGQDLALIVATYSVGRYTTDHRHSIATVGVAIAVSIIGSIIDSHQRIDIAPTILVIGLPWYVGRRIRNRGDYLALLQERAVRLEAEQLARARQAVAEERSRIARELHDVVAHRVSMMTVQAGAAKTIAHDDLDAAVDAMSDVEHAGRQALGELRHLLGVLRPDTAVADDLGPQPGLADIAALTDELTHTGADVTLTIADLPDDLPVAVDLSAYRIVQESLTNVVRHAGPDPVVHVSVRRDDRNLVIEIDNTVNTVNGTSAVGPQPSDLPESGYGISGMRERANLLGGTLVAESRGIGRYHVRARLPIEPEPS